MSAPHTSMPPGGAFAANSATPAVSGVLLSWPVALYGWSLRETSGTAVAQIQLINGSTSGGGIVAEFNLNPSDSIRELAPFGGIWCSRGLFVNVVAGAATVTCWVGQGA